MNSFISACVISVLGFWTSERSAAVFMLALPFRQTRPDLEIPAHSPPDIDRVSRERVQSKLAAGRPFSLRRPACNIAEAPEALSPATPACPSQAWPHVAQIPECPRNSPFGQ